MRILELTHSDSMESKRFAAANIKNYITLFPDLEDDVINAIYDLCEDQASLVRSKVFGVSPQTQLFAGSNTGVSGYSCCFKTGP